MTTLYDLYVMMAEYNGDVAYGSECPAYQDFVNASCEEFKITPFNDRAMDVEFTDDDKFLTYWQSVALGNCSDYDDTGDR